ncbi:TetR/AcrR family transcriptional regulator [Labrenzia sp. DG1229]|uniref:TetR/AcrR family transcriptional regulator n=1 Tax=Labrenzia sp. DG1229 TaxID=681847 RepID=UPI00069194E9|nr:TetR/AcrR family transcriptional regulator [Labrenzia sp. DG1229]
MARPKSYNVEEVVERVVHAFWQHGYQALGLRELEHLTGLNQFAIRSEFGGKEGLYLTALELYTEAAISHAMQPVRDGRFLQISVFLRSLVTDGSMTSSKYGCLIVNTGIENARVGSTRLEEAVRRYWHELESSFLVCLQNAIEAEEIDPDIDPEPIAKGLVSAVMGVHAQNRLDQKNDAGKQLVEILCGQLKSMELS